MDLLRHRLCHREMQSCSVLVLTETWLNNNMPDVFELAGRLLFRSDKDRQLSGKTRGGGLCIYINKAVFIAAVYVPPQATANVALKELQDSIGSLQNKHPEALYVVAGDFNHVKSSATPPPRRLGSHLSPARSCILPRSKNPDTKTICVWPEGAVSRLQDCFETTDWQIFREAATSESNVDLEEYTTSVMDYIRTCMENVTTSKTITIRQNQKPWINGEVRSLLRTRDAAFRDGDEAALKTARRNLSAGIKRAKATYALKIQGHFTSNDP
ncbi:uncharacterized protein LOC134314382 [Trichomycterus rosablanca]|uniref:uncharacterized protein LOC134314382 n=1 Tax=Trichomycterus rosablanca TaxID=2290929 RepID=UPI002F35F28B